MRSARVRLLVLVLGLVLLARADIAHTASNTAPASLASDSADAITADKLKPSECAGITLTALVYGSGTINGSPGTVNELITGSAGADTINADGGDDCVLAGGGVDTVKGEAGGDVVLAGGGGDHLSGGAGDDTLDGETGTDRCYGGTGTNTILNCEDTDLDPPHGLVAGPGTTTADIDLTWTASPALLVAGYNIYRSTTAGGGYALIDSVSGRLTTSYTDSPPDVDGDYYYVVAAYFESLISLYTNEAARIVRVTVGDAHVREDVGDGNEGAGTSLSVNAESTKLRRVFAQFDLSDLPTTANVAAARLRAYIRAGGAPGQSRTYQAQRVAASWGEMSITWNNQPAVGGSAVATSTGTSEQVWNEWTVTTDVQAFAGGTAANYGWRISDQAEGTGQDQTDYHSRENTVDAALSPQVRVFYADTMDLMLLVLDPASLDADRDVPLRDYVEKTLGYNVSLHDATSSGWTPTDYDAVVISESVTSDDTAWLLSEAVGILTVEGANWDELDLGTGGSSTGGNVSVDITDNTHYITVCLPTGLRTVATSGANMGYISGWSGGVQKLAHFGGAPTDAYLLAVDKGGALVPSGTAAERRVFLGAQFFANANGDGRSLFQRALHWVAYRTAPCGRTATVSGSVVPTSTEAGIVAGGKTIVITLANETWDASIGQNNSRTTDLINGIDSAQAEANGWDAVVKANMDYNDVVRTSDTVVTITLGAEASYDITATETITVTVPASAVASATAIVAAPAFKVVSDTLDIVLLVADPASLDADKDVPLKDFLETTLGHNVTVHDATSSGWTPTDHDAMVVSESVTSANTGWLLSETVGILTVEGANWDELDLGSGGSSNGGDTTVDITDNSHYITSVFSTGNRTVSTSGTNMGYITGWGGGVQKLAHYASASTQAYLLAVEQGGALVPSGTAAERRVFLGAQFFADANADGQTLVQRALDWVAHRDAP